jgi:hypothetical protein
MQMSKTYFNQTKITTKTKEENKSYSKYFFARNVFLSEPKITVLNLSLKLIFLKFLELVRQ